MTISEKPTETILLKVQTNSEWDGCDFALISCTEAWRNMTSDRANEVKTLSRNQDFYCQIYWDTPLGYFCNADPDYVIISDYLNQQEQDWCFVAMESGEPDSLPVPENRLDSHQLVITAGGNAHYKAYGKHSGEEFWTTSFHITEILESFNR